MEMGRYLGVKGISCMQLKRDDVGQLRFLEVNAHMGGTSIATILAGVDIVRFLLSIASGESFPIPPVTEMTIVRHFDEIVLPCVSGKIA
jgi:carbamoyl-phosphate synthase large subunit